MMRVLAEQVVPVHSDWRRELLLEENYMGMDPEGLLAVAAQVSYWQIAQVHMYVPQMKVDRAVGSTSEVSLKDLTFQRMAFPSL